MVSPEDLQSLESGEFGREGQFKKVVLNGKRMKRWNTVTDSWTHSVFGRDHGDPIRYGTTSYYFH